MDYSQKNPLEVFLEKHPEFLQVPPNGEDDVHNANIVRAFVSSGQTDLEQIYAMGKERNLFRLPAPPAPAPQPDMAIYSDGMPHADATGKMFFKHGTEEDFIRQAPRAKVEEYLRENYGRKPAPNILPTTSADSQRHGAHFDVVSE